jgi:hypothetical protein
MLLTSKEFNGHSYQQDLPISVSIAFAMSNVATFVKKPLYKSTPRRRKKRDERQRRYRDHNITPRKRSTAAATIAIHFSSS